MLTICATKVAPRARFPDENGPNPGKVIQCGGRGKRRAESRGCVAANGGNGASSKQRPRVYSQNILCRLRQGSEWRRRSKVGRKGYVEKAAARRPLNDPSKERDIRNEGWE